jgi:hypothetical protein
VKRAYVAIGDAREGEFLALLERFFDLHRSDHQGASHCILGCQNIRREDRSREDRARLDERLGVSHTDGGRSF